MVTFKEMDKTCFELYDQVTQNVEIKSEYLVEAARIIREK